MSSKTRYNISFKNHWLTNNEFSSWLQKIGGNVHCAKCRVHSKTISVSGQGGKCFGAACKKCQTLRISQPVETSTLK